MVHIQEIWSLSLRNKLETIAPQLGLHCYDESSDCTHMSKNKVAEVARYRIERGLTGGA